MRLYEIYQGEALQGSLIVHDDGRKEWDWMRHDWPGSDDLKTAIEQAADADPQAESGKSLLWCITALSSPDRRCSHGCGLEPKSGHNQSW
jgi:hypothetical protein